MSKNKIEAFVSAAEQGDLDTINRLASGVDPEGVSYEHDKTALEMAAIRGHLDAVKLLLDLGVSPNAFGWHPALHCAAITGHAEIIACLLENGAEVDLAAREINETALMFAAGRGHLDCARLLIEAGANVSHVSAMRKMPLSEAYSYEDRRKKRNPVVDLLIESGAKLSEHYQKTWKDWKRPEA